MEREIRDLLGDLLGDLEVLVYFTRRATDESAATPATPVPAPLKERKSPFGLMIDKRAIPGVTEVIVVASGKGGVGKSTVSVNLATALAAAGRRVGLLDADIYGPSAPLMLGVSGPLAVEGGARLVPKVAHGVKVVSFGFLTDTTEPVIWRGPMIAKAFKQLAYDVAWGELDYLIVDLPPGTGDIQLALIESLPIHGALIVTTPQDVALLDAHKALSMFQRLDVRVLGLVENMALHTCSRCGHEEALFGAGGADRMALERKLEVLARLPLAMAVREGGDRGVPIALLGETTAAREFARLAAAVQQL
jgi:ATP-binding protein involved in chromosome partitioning